jgi:hypothetical protein
MLAVFPHRPLAVKEMLAGMVIPVLVPAAEAVVLVALE